jgi:hypothetical protein
MSYNVLILGVGLEFMGFVRINGYRLGDIYGL